MKESLIKAIQKFLNAPFRYSELLIFLDKQKDLLLQKNVLDKMDDDEYNALWDVIVHLENLFAYAKGQNMVIGCEVSVLKLFDNNYKERTIWKTKKQTQP